MKSMAILTSIGGISKSDKSVYSGWCILGVRAYWGSLGNPPVGLFSATSLPPPRCACLLLTYSPFPNSAWSFHVGPAVALIIAPATIYQVSPACQGLRGHPDSVSLPGVWPYLCNKTNLAWCLIAPLCLLSALQVLKLLVFLMFSSLT